MIQNLKTFILTIPRNRERFNVTMAHLKENGIEPAIFNGIDGTVSGLTSRFEFRFFNKETDTLEDVSKWVALYVNHYVLWSLMASDNTHDAFIILEDDVRFVDGWLNHLELAMRHIASDWDLLHIGSCCCEDKPDRAQIHERLWSIKQAWCTHAYAIRKKALPILLEKCQRIDAKLDTAIALDAMPSLKCFAMLPRLCEQDGTLLHP